MTLPAKGRQIRTADHPKPVMRNGADSSSPPSQGTEPLNTSVSGYQFFFYCLQNCATINLFFKPPNLRYFVMTKPRSLIQNQAFLTLWSGVCLKVDTTLQDNYCSVQGVITLWPFCLGKWKAQIPPRQKDPQGQEAKAFCKITEDGLCWEWSYLTSGYFSLRNVHFSLVAGSGLLVRE